MLKMAYLYLCVFDVGGVLVFETGLEQIRPRVPIHSRSICQNRGGRRNFNEYLSDAEAKKAKERQLYLKYHKSEVGAKKAKCATLLSDSSHFFFRSARTS